eukprot:1793759-Prymnesium_polylepis.1
MQLRSWGEPTHIRVLPAVRLPPSSPGTPRELRYGNCPPGCGRPSGSDACALCQHGSYGTGNGVCTLCGVGRYGNRSTVPAGLAAQASACRSCPPGQYSPVHGATACRLCPRGAFCADGWTLTAQGELVAAPISGRISLPTLCPRGRFNPDQGAPGPHACRLCAPGRYRVEPNATRAAQCLSCVPGSFAAANGSHGCALCPASTASDVVAAPSCSICAPGRFSAADGALACSACPLGAHGPAAGGVSPTCTLCGAGTFGDTLGLSRCVDCPNGTISAALGAHAPDTCEACLEGTYTPPNISGASECRACPNRSEMVIRMYRGREWLREPPADTCVYAASGAGRRGQGAASAAGWVAVLVATALAVVVQR